MGATIRTRTGHSEKIRNILRSAREKQGLHWVDVGRKIGNYLREDGDENATDPSDSSVRSWERMERHPSIANFAAWARVLGYRLIVELDGADVDRKPVLVETFDAAEAARRIDHLPPDHRGAVIDILRWIDDLPEDRRSDAIAFVDLASKLTDDQRKALVPVVRAMVPPGLP